MELGTYNELEISRKTEDGFILSDENNVEVFLSAAEGDVTWEIGKKLNVFVYEGFLGKKKATLKTPKIQLNQFSYLPVSSIEDIGVFVDWGMEKHLLIPPKQEGQRMYEDESHIIFMYKDKMSGKIYGSNKIEKRLSNEVLTVEEGDEVDLLVQRESDLGYVVIVNHKHRGLVFENDIFQELKEGDQLKGFVKKIQPENRLDISIRPMGYRNAITPDSKVILEALKEADGFLPLTDKSPPDLIMVELNLSKKAFKRAVGALYKSKKIEIKDSGIHLL